MIQCSSPVFAWPGNRIVQCRHPAALTTQGPRGTGKYVTCLKHRIDLEGFVALFPQYRVVPIK